MTDSLGEPDISFTTSSFCNWGNCVEVARRPDGSVLVRDSKDESRRSVLDFTPGEWSDFVKGVKAGEFDLEL